MTLDGAQRSVSRFDATTRVVAVVALGVGLLGCGSSPSSAPSVAQPASVAPVATVQATVAATSAPTEAAAAEPCSTASSPDCPMPDGDYRATLSGGGISFTLSGGPWANLVYDPLILSLHRGTDWVVFMNAPVLMLKGDALGPTPDAAAAQKRLASLPGIEVAEVDEPMTIGGRDAVAFDVDNTGSETKILLSLAETSDRYELEPGARVRFYWVAGDGDPFVFALESRAETFEAFLEEAVPIRESIAFVA